MDCAKPAGLAAFVPAPPFDPAHSLLLTDLYELNMMQAYYEADMTAPAVFEFFVRKLPPTRGFLMAAGLEQVIEFLQHAQFTPAELDWLKSSGRFSGDFVDRIAAFSFTGDVDAMPEGTVFFADEPILRVAAPLPEAQLIETRVINFLHYQTLVASKAARMVLAAPDKTLIDFGLRRAHGSEAGLLAGRASYLAGFTGTATTLAGQLFDIPIYGTMAHSFIQAYDDETAALEAFARARPADAVLLLDTYDTEAAAEKVVALAPRLRADGIAIRGVRLDSGDLAAHARRVRGILDGGGLDDVAIFASGGIDESELQRFGTIGAPINGYGIGTCLTTSIDAAALDCAYKLQEYGGRARRKRSEGKATWPGRKQVYRYTGADGAMDHDQLTLVDDAQDGQPLLQPILRDGQLVGTPPSLRESRAYAAAELCCLPPHLRELATGPAYRVEVTKRLRALVAVVDREQEGAALEGEPCR